MIRRCKIEGNAKVQFLQIRTKNLFFWFALVCFELSQASHAKVDAKAWRDFSIFAVASFRDV